MQESKDPKLKYNIQKFLDQLPRGISVEGELEKMGITRSTFYRDKKILVKQRNDIPTERLVIYADFFGVTVESLINYSIRKNGSKRKLKTHLE